jgi:hypothetical protein
MSQYAEGGQGADGIESWLPELTRIPLDELPALGDRVLGPAAALLLRGIDHPISSIGGSQGS